MINDNGTDLRTLKELNTQVTNNADVLNEFNKITSNVYPTTNFATEYWANLLKYIKVGRIVFCDLVINTKATTGSASEDATITMPFTFNGHWWQSPISAGGSHGYYIHPMSGTNKLRIETNARGNTPIKANAVGSGYVVTAQFFAFLQ